MPLPDSTGESTSQSSAGDGAEQTRGTARTWIQFATAVSGLVLIVSYSAGRVFLESYYGQFDVEFSELDLTIQDVTFASFENLLQSAWSFGLIAVIIYELLLITRTVKRHGLIWWTAVSGVPVGLIMALNFLEDERWLAIWIWWRLVLVPWMAISAAQMIRIMIEEKSELTRVYIAGGLIFTLGVAFPTSYGTTVGKLDRWDDDAGKTVVILQGDIVPGWTAARGDVFVTPPVRVLGTGHSMMVVWDPAQRKKVAVPVALVEAIVPNSSAFSP